MKSATECYYCFKLTCLLKGRCVAKQVGQMPAARIPWVLGSSLLLMARWPWVHSVCRLARTFSIAAMGGAARSTNLGWGEAEEHLFKS